MDKVDIWAAAAAYLLTRSCDTAEEITWAITGSGITTLGLKGKTPEATVRSILYSAKYPGTDKKVFTSEIADEVQPPCLLFRLIDASDARGNSEVMLAAELLEKSLKRRKAQQTADETIVLIQKTISTIERSLAGLSEQVELLRGKLE